MLQALDWGFGLALHHHPLSSALVAWPEGPVSRLLGHVGEEGRQVMSRCQWALGTTSWPRDLVHRQSHQTKALTALNRNVML
jgi:hypothetical protein